MKNERMKNLRKFMIELFFRFFFDSCYSIHGLPECDQSIRNSGTIAGSRFSSKRSNPGFLDILHQSLLNLIFNKINTIRRNILRKFNIEINFHNHNNKFKFILVSTFWVIFRGKLFLFPDECDSNLWKGRVF